MPTKELIAEICQRRLRGFTAPSRDEMRLVGYADAVPATDVCAEPRGPLRTEMNGVAMPSGPVGRCVWCPI